LSAETDFWEDRYKAGYDSGRTYTWEWNAIDAFVPSLDDVIDVGCGDLKLWEARQLPARYVGIDLSQAIIDRNRLRWPSGQFVCAPSQEPLQIDRAPVVLCLDLLFHIMDESDYEHTVSNLGQYSSDLLFVSAWRRNPFAEFRKRLRASAYRLKEGHIKSALVAQLGSSDGAYQKYHAMAECVSILGREGVQLISTVNAPNLYGALYVFKRNEK